MLTRVYRRHEGGYSGRLIPSGLHSDIGVDGSPAGITTYLRASDAHFASARIPNALRQYFMRLVLVQLGQSSWVVARVARWSIDMVPTRHLRRLPMRAEIQKHADDIKESLALLRRHL